MSSDSTELIHAFESDSIASDDLNMSRAIRNPTDLPDMHLLNPRARPVRAVGQT